jgi:hypothetical protein
MGMAEINNAEAATMIAEEKRIVCDSCDIESGNFEGECRKMASFYVLDIIF